MRDCFSRNMELSDGKAVVIWENCMMCGHCIAVCPKGAVSFDDHDMSEVVECGGEACAPGAAWFEEHDKLKDGSYVLSPGDIIFFDHGSNESIDHVGIVVNVTDGVVNTIEGNTGDSCKQRSYPIGRADIYGYGVPAY